LVIEYNDQQIATGTSNNFELPADGIKYILTSQQLSLGVASIPNSNGIPQTIELSNYDVDFTLAGNLEDQALQTGTAPSGNYEFILTGTDPSGNTIAPDMVPGNNSITITNPTYIELNTPGYSVNDPIIMEIYSRYPFYQWQTDVPPTNVSNYSVFVYQKYPEDETTQDVLNHPPMLHMEGYQSNFFQYPTSTNTNSILDPYPTDLIELQILALRPLEPGNTYYWFVRSNIPSGTGTVIIESDVFRFKIADVAGTNSSAQQLVAILQQMLGQNFGQVLSSLIEQGFDPNGEINYNGQSGDMNTLMDLANQIVSGQATIQSVEVY
jgi:hypothetical protein